MIPVFAEHLMKDKWILECGEALAAQGITNFHPLEIADVGRVAIATAEHRTDRPRWKAELEAPSLELLPNALMLCELLCELRAAEPVSSVLVNSWYRDSLYNYTIGGTSNSMHMTCGAADVVKKGWSTREVADWFEAHSDADQFGVGRYHTFTHIDIRGKLGRPAPARWGSHD